MPDVTVNAIHEARIVGQNHAGLTNNVLYFGQTVDIFDNPDSLNTFLTTLATALRDNVVNTLLPALPGDWNFRHIDIRQVQPEKSDYIVVGPAAPATGALTETAPSQVSQVVIWRSGFGRKRGRGRTSLPPPPKSGMSSSSLTTAQLALVAAWATDMLDRFRVTDGSFGQAVFGVYSKTDIKENKPFNEAFRPIFSGTVNAIAGSVDRRQFGRGA